MLFSEVSKAFIAAYQGRDPQLAARLAFWVDQFGSIPFVEVTTEQIDDALDALAARGAMRNIRGLGAVATGRRLAGGTINRYRAALGTLYKWARETRLVKRTFVAPHKAVPQQKENGGSLVYLTLDQFNRLVVAARLMTWKKFPALLMLAFTTGMRRGTIEAIRWKDVHLQARRIDVPRTKNNAPYVAHLTAETLAELQAIPGIHDPQALVFGCSKGHDRAHNWNHTWTKCFDVAGIPRVHFHALRHSCASHAAANGASNVMLMNLLAHKSLRMVERYAHLNTDARSEFVDRVFSTVQAAPEIAPASRQIPATTALDQPASPN